MALKIKTLYLIIIIHFLAIFFLVLLFANAYIKSLEEIEYKYALDFMEKIEKEIGYHKLASGGKETIIEILRDLEKKEDLKNLRIFNSKDKLVYSIGKEDDEKNKNLERESFKIEKGFLSFNLNLENNYPCNTCHTKGEKNVGRVEGKLDLNKSLGFIQEKKKVLKFTFFLGFFIFIIVTVFYLNFFLKPLNLILEAIQKVKKGNLDFSIDFKRKDEMGVLISNFNELVQNLKNAKEEVERFHKKEIERAEHLASIGVIASGLAHEVKNPLAGINAAIETLLEENKLEEEQRNVLTQIKEETRRILEIINRLLDYSKPSKPLPIEFDLELFLKDIETIIRPQLKQKSIDLNMNLDGKDRILFHDPNILKQIIINLLQNSIQAVQTGGKICLNVSLKEKEVVFEIIDNGEGIEEKIKDRIFEPFFTTKISGSGLGLSIVNKLVREIDGIISFESKKGEGTKFYIKLPKRLKIT